MRKQNTISIQKALNIFRQGFKLSSFVWNKIWRIFIIRGITTCLLAVLPIIQAYGLGELVNSLQINNTNIYSTEILFPIILLCGGTLISSSLSTFNITLTNIFFWKSIYQFQLIFNFHVSDLDIARLEEPETQDLITKVSENFFAIVRFTDRLFPLSECLIKCLITVAVLTTASPLLVLLIVALAIPHFLADVRYGAAIYKMESEIAEDRRRGYLVSLFLREKNKLQEIKLFRATKNFKHKLTYLNDGFVYLREKVDKKYSWIRVGLGIVSEFPVVCYILLLIYNVISGKLSVGGFAFLITALGSFRGAISQLLTLVAEQNSAYPFVNDFIQLSELKPVIVLPRNGIKISRENIPPRIDFEKVTFYYPGQSTPVLDNVSFTINSGEKVAFVGEIGAGKSTLIKLLFRVYDPSSGKININGIDLKDVDLESWYKILGVMPQEFNHYFFTVREGIALGQPDTPIDDELVEQSAKNSGSFDFIKSLPQEFNTVTDRMFKKGIELSKGQNQLLSLTRVLYRNAQVLVLDEPTSAFDAITEAKAFDFLQSLSGVSMLFIAHRLSTVRQADTIYVLDQGRIKEYGTHYDLLKKKCIYANLFTTQSQHYQ